MTPEPPKNFRLDPYDRLVRRVKSRTKGELLHTLMISKPNYSATPKPSKDRRVFKSCRPQFRKTVSSYMTNLKRSDSSFRRFPDLNIVKALHTKFVYNDDVH